MHTISIDRLMIGVTLLMLFHPISSFAKSVTRSKEKILEGVVVANSWTKSGASYCHGGSVYFVLDTGDSKLTIGSDRSPEPRNISLSDLKKFSGQKVRITGTLVTRLMGQEEHCPDPKMQCFGGSISCQHIEVKTISTSE